MSDMPALMKAFEDLEAQGILARHNYWCCGSCGGCGLAIEHKENPQPGTIGGVFYHEQSAERALNGGGLMLYYDAIPSGNGHQAEIGEKAVTALRAQGLTVEWDGNPYSAIEIPKFEVTLAEIPKGVGNTLHDTYGATDEDDAEFWGYDEEEDEGF